MSDDVIAAQLVAVRAEVERLRQRVALSDVAVQPLLEAVRVLEERLAHEPPVQHRARELRSTAPAALQASPGWRELESLLLEAPAGVCIVHGPAAIVTFTNPRFDQLFGRGDVRGHPVSTVFPELIDHGMDAALDGVRTSGVPIVGNDVLVQLDRYRDGHREDGDGNREERAFSFTCTPLRNPDAPITDLLIHVLEVTETVRDRQEADAALLRRDQSLAIAAHELKTPLTALLGYAQLLESRLSRVDTADVQAQYGLGLIVEHGQRLNRLIEALLDVARLDQGRVQLVRQPLDLTALVQRAVGAMRDAVETHTFQLHGVKRPVIIDGDELRLEQVLVNLLHNAVKYSPQGSAIDISLAATGAQGCVVVQDHGIGIPPAALPHIFERFYRVGGAAARDPSGLGLGLFVVNEIVTQHGGMVEVNSTEGAGSRFQVCLPLSQHGAGDSAARAG
jgi:signal transduction histidine kinase